MRPQTRPTAWLALPALFVLVALSACTAFQRPAPPAPATVSLPLRLAWMEGHEVRYVTTDVSDPAAAADQGVNHVPRLAQALRAASGQGLLERVYRVMNFNQRPVFPSAPEPVGARSTDRNYSPLWRLVTVTWKDPAQATELRSEEQILAAEEQGRVAVQVTDLVLNCPIVSVEGRGTLPGVSW